MNKNIILDLQLSEASLKAKLRRANKSDADYAIIIGDEEIRTDTVIFKYLKDESNDQETLSVDELFNIYKSI
jgi:histidyl-tRNA synthetase